MEQKDRRATVAAMASDKELVGVTLNQRRDLEFQ
jgi:hypothetical protein